MVVSILLLLVLCRGIIYRSLVTYHPIAERQNYNVTSKQFQLFLDEKTISFEPMCFDDILDKSLEITTTTLSYNLYIKDVNPNKTLLSGKAHCVGYSAFYATVCNYLLQKYNYKDTRCTAYAGAIYVLGYNVHNLFSSTAFKDHDYNVVHDGFTGHSDYVDPTLYDYSYIKSVSAK